MSTDAPGAISSGAEPPAATPARGGARARTGRGADDGSPGPDDAAQSGAPRFDLGLGDGRAPQALLAAVVAWMITVAPAAFARGAPTSAAVTAALAFLCGVAAPLLAGAHRRLARHIGISAFLTLVTVTWLLASPSLQPSRLDPVRAAIGAIAWGIFALSWRDRWEARRQPEPDPDAPLLQARSHLPPLATAVAAFGALVSVAILALAWRVRDPDRALLAQAVAVACAVALITAASAVAVGRGRGNAGGARRLTHRAVRQLLVLIVFAVLGAVVMMLR